MCVSVYICMFVYISKIELNESENNLFFLCILLTFNQFFVANRSAAVSLSSSWRRGEGVVHVIVRREHRSLHEAIYRNERNLKKNASRALLSAFRVFITYYVTYFLYLRLGASIQVFFFLEEKIFPAIAVCELIFSFTIVSPFCYPSVE